MHAACLAAAIRRRLLHGFLEAEPYSTWVILMESLWTQTAHMEPFPTLEGEAKTDVLVSGGGMAGVLCAYFLKQAGIDCLLVEGNRIGGGVTGNTTAKITFQHGLCYGPLLRKKGREQAALYLNAGRMALSAFRELCAGMDCDFQEKNAFVFSRQDRKAIEQEVEAANRLGEPASFVRHVPLPISIAGAVCFENQAQFHPLKFLRAIAKELPIYEQTFVRQLKGNTAITQKGAVRAEKMVIATHFPFLNKHGAYFLKMYQHRSYAVALTGAPQVEGMYLEEVKDGLSFRNQGEWLILGGGDHRTGLSGGNWQTLRGFARQAWPKAREGAHWATQDCMTLDGLPYIGPYAKATPNLYVATGFNKWGMTSAMTAAILLTDQILGRKNEFAQLFSPSRGMAAGPLALNGLNALGGYLYPTVRRCPHLGCALRWNPAERTWDCSCHGSRFAENGALIDNPATGGLRR